MGIAEHVENAGTHSGDASLLLPAQKLFVETHRRVKQIGQKICRALKISGPFNIQFMCKENEVMVMECIAAKVPQFSFGRLKNSDPRLGVEMQSTGEVACFGVNQYEAFLKSMIAAGFRLPTKNIFVSIGPRQQKLEFLQ